MHACLCVVCMHVWVDRVIGSVKVLLDAAASTRSNTGRDEGVWENDHSGLQRELKKNEEIADR